MRVFNFTFLSIILLLLVSLNASAETTFSQKLVKAALERTKHIVRYDPKYVRIKYPGGDVPIDTGVCSDVIIRSYRALGFDLQKLVHEDMKRNFRLYPRTWGLKRPDTNIDHRRVLNLEVFFKRHGQSLPITKNAKNYKPGDLVTWNLSSERSIPHIGIVTNKKSFFTGNPMIVHNIGLGPKLEDILFTYKITGHFRYNPSKN